MPDDSSLPPATPIVVVRQVDEVQEIFPVTMNLGWDDDGMYDFRPLPVDSAVPDPKDSSAAVSADFLVVEQETPENTGISPESETTAPVVEETSTVTVPVTSTPTSSQTAKTLSGSSKPVVKE